MTAREIPYKVPETDPLAVDLVQSAAEFVLDRLNRLPPERHAQITALMRGGAQPGVIVRAVNPGEDDHRALATLCVVDGDGNVLELSQHVVDVKGPAH